MKLPGDTWDDRCVSECFQRGFIELTAEPHVDLVVHRHAFTCAIAKVGYDHCACRRARHA